MGTRTRFATWFREGRVFRVLPPDWPRRCELSFSDRDLMRKWAWDNRYMLREKRR